MNDNLNKVNPWVVIVIMGLAPALGVGLFLLKEKINPTIRSCKFSTVCLIGFIVLIAGYVLIFISFHKVKKEKNSGRVDNTGQKGYDRTGEKRNR